MSHARAMCVLALLLAFAGPSEASEIKVTLLGTGGPVPRIDRFQAGILVEAGSEKVLIDCGRGVPIRLWQIHVPLSAVTAVFITHLHSDHTIGLPDLLLTGWLNGPFGGRTAALRIRGPKGTKAMMRAMRQAWAWDIKAREGDEKLPPAGSEVVATDIGEGVAYERNGVKVTAFTVDHGDLLKPALGYRVDYGGHSVVFSGDTRPTENLVRFASGADVLVHEVAQARPELMETSAAARRIIAHHTTPGEAGTIFSRVKPKLAVYSHIALITTEASIPPPTVDELVAATRTTYSGPLEVGADLTEIDIGDTVTVKRPPSP